jgi:hypothetical protein
VLLLQPSAPKRDVSYDVAVLIVSPLSVWLPASGSRKFSQKARGDSLGESEYAMWNRPNLAQENREVHWEVTGAFATASPGDGEHLCLKRPQRLKEHP